MSQPVIRVENVTKQLRLGNHIIYAIRGVNIEVHPGEMIGIVGPSGSGKSTLLGILGGLDKPTSGNIFIDEINITEMGEDQLTEIRNQKIGFIFQFFNLIPTLTALENVALPIQFAQQRRYDPHKRAKELLEMLGLEDRIGHRPAELSGGQQQRVAIARALANGPPLLLADEPTGNLDSESTTSVIKALENIRNESGTTVVLVTHDSHLAKDADRILTLVDGIIMDDVINNQS